MLFEIKTSVAKYPIVVYATSYQNPLSKLNEVAEEMMNHTHQPCEVLFDLLLANGDEFNRFVLGFFDGTTIDYASLQVIAIDDTVLPNLNRYYHGKLSMLSHSVLSVAQQRRFAFRSNCLESMRLNEWIPTKEEQELTQDE